MVITDSREVGLAIGQILGSRLFGFEDLHYGYWADQTEISIHNFSIAQEKYSQFLIDHIPAGVQSILDVGAGSGNLAQRLIARGYSVDCLSPSQYLTTRIRERLGDLVGVITSRIETSILPRKYDLVLFSESFQYVDMRVALSKTLAALNPGGFILISDFFKRTHDSSSPLGGGHLFEEFNSIIRELKLNATLDLDITNETAPTIGMFGELLTTTVSPVKDMVCGFIQHRHPSLYKFLAWKFKGRFARISNTYFSGKLTSESFKEFKTYRFLILQPSQG